MSDVQLPPEFEWDLNLQSGEETAALTKEVWPRFLTEESDLPQAPPQTRLSDSELARRFPLWGIRSKSNRDLVAFASAVLVHMDLSKDSLPDGGWQAAIESYYADAEPNCLCLLSANVDPKMRNLKFSYALLEQGKTLARKLGLDTVIAPVRPSQKVQFPYMKMAEYRDKRLASGELFDPWLRVHLNLGGEILNVCSRSVVVSATISKWREWTNFPLAQSGQYLVPMGLVPLAVDLDRNIGIYSEPNVWVRYKLGN